MEIMFQSRKFKLVSKERRDYEYDAKLYEVIQGKEILVATCQGRSTAKNYKLTVHSTGILPREFLRTMTSELGIVFGYDRHTELEVMG